MDEIRYMEATLRPDAPPFMEPMLLFMRSQVEEGTEYTGKLYPISGTLEESDYLRMTPEGVWIGVGGSLISHRESYSSRHLDPVMHLFLRIQSLLARLERIIKQHDPSHVSVVKEDSVDEEGSDEDVESDDESNANKETYTERVFRLTGWSWDMILTYLVLVLDNCQCV